MMPRSIFQRLRVFVIVAFCGLLSACGSFHKSDNVIAADDEVWCSPIDQGDLGCTHVANDSSIKTIAADEKTTAAGGKAIVADEKTISAGGKAIAADEKAIAADDEVWCAPTDQGDLGCIHVANDSPICPITYNVMQCRFFGAGLMGETKRQFRELYRALQEALELPIEELQKPRYTDFTGATNKWTFAEIISSHYSSGGMIRGWGWSSVSTKGFYPSLKLPESIPVLKQRLKEAKEAIGKAVIER